MAYTSLWLYINAKLTPAPTDEPLDTVMAPALTASLLLSLLVILMFWPVMLLY